MTAFDTIRAQFPVTEHWIYLNHAAACPIPLAAREAMTKRIEDQTRNGTVNHDRWSTDYERVRRLAAKLVHAETEQIAFIQNTSDGVSTVAGGITWQAGDNIVLPEIEFPSNFYAWRQLEHKGVEVRLVSAPNGYAAVDDLRAAMDSKTRLVALSYVQFSSGYRYPLSTIATLCREIGALLFVDGTQAVGALEIDVTDSGIDILAVSAHKWMLGPLGIGFSCFSSRALEAIFPPRLGWLSVENPFDFDYQLRLPKDASRFEAGTENAVGIAGLGGTLDIIFSLGPKAIEDRVLALTDHLEEGLRLRGLDIISPREREQRSGILSARPREEDPANILARREQAGILCSVRNGGIRFSPHYYNSYAELHVALKQLDSS